MKYGYRRSIVLTLIWITFEPKFECFRAQVSSCSIHCSLSLLRRFRDTCNHDRYVGKLSNCGDSTFTIIQNNYNFGHTPSSVIRNGFFRTKSKVEPANHSRFDELRSTCDATYRFLQYPSGNSRCTFCNGKREKRQYTIVASFNRFSTTVRWVISPPFQNS